MAQANSRVDDQNCCFWVKHSESCAQVKHATAALVVALTAITLVAGVLLILAQQGYNLAGINSIAQMVDPKWIYLGMGVAGIVLAITTTFIGAQVHAYLNKTFSEDELTKRGYIASLATNHIVERLGPNSYMEVSEFGQGDLPSIFGVISKDQHGRPTLNPYLALEDADVRIARLAAQGYADGRAQEAQRPEYLMDHVAALIGEDPYEYCQEFFDDLEMGSYRLEVPVMLGGVYEAFLLATHDLNGAQELRFFKTEEARSNALRNEYAHLYSKAELEELIINSYPGPSLKDDEFWPFTVNFAGRDHHVITHNEGEGITFPYFPTPEASRAYAASGGENVVDLNAQFYKTHKCSPEELERFFEEDAIQKIQEIKLNQGEYGLFTLQMTSTLQIYHIAVNHAGTTVHSFFKRNWARQEYLNEVNLDETLINVADIDAAIYGTEALQPQINWQVVEAALTQEKDYWPSTISVGGHDLFVILEKGEKGSTYVYSRSANECVEVMKTTYGTHTNAFARQIEIKDRLEQLLTDTDFATYPSHLGTYVFYKGTGPLTWNIVAPNQLDDFVNGKTLTPVQKADRYPEALAVALSPNHSLQKIVAGNPYLGKKEFLQYVEVKTQDPNYPRFFPLVVRDDMGQYQAYYFKTEGQRGAFLEGKGLTSGFIRDREHEEYVKVVSPFVLPELKTQDPLLFIFPRRDGDACFVTRTSGGKIEKRYVTADRVEEEKKAMLASHLHVSNEILAEIPLSQQETAYIDSEIKAVPQNALSNVQRWFKEPEGLKEKQYVIRTKGGGAYAALLIRGPNQTNQSLPQWKTYFYRTCDPQYREKLEELEAAEYKNADHIK